jgi:O-methyltransferase domain
MPTTELSVIPGSQAQDAERLLQLATGFVFTAALQPIVRLKIADLVGRGPVSASELARQTGTNADALYRVLRLLASVGIFAELPGRAFVHTPMSELLRTDVPGSVRDTVTFVGNPLHFKVWAELGYSVETGKPAIDKVYGKPAFEAIFGDSENAADFNRAMTCFSRRIAPTLLDAYDFSTIHTLMDVAGGHGAVLCDVLRRYPAMKGILFDMPNVVQEATCYICSLNLDQRCQMVSGDFFEHIPPGADAYYMQHIIHDWADEPALKILGNCRRALEGVPNGRLLIVDSVVPENSEPHVSKWLDIEMLLMPGGRERTEQEWRGLLARGGFDVTRIVAMNAAESIIEARPQN